MLPFPNLIGLVCPCRDQFEVKDIAVSNPFFAVPPSPPTEETFEPDELLGRRLVVLGPPVPPGTGAGPPRPAMPRQVVGFDALLWVVGLHGGSGATSVATALGADVVESPRAWPVSRPLEPQVLLVARTHVVGLAAAEAAIQEWASAELRDLRLLGVVLVDDAPRIARPLLPVMNRVLHSSPRGWHLPWQETWRFRLPDDRPLTFSARRTLGDIRRRALVEGQKPGDNPLLDQPLKVESAPKPTVFGRWRKPPAETHEPVHHPKSPERKASS